MTVSSQLLTEKNYVVAQLLSCVQLFATTIHPDKLIHTHTHTHPYAHHIFQETRLNA